MGEWKQLVISKFITQNDGLADYGPGSLCIYRNWSGVNDLG